MPLFKTMVFVLSGISLVLCMQKRTALTGCVESFPCRVPQPRAIYLQELVDQQDWKDNYESIKDHILPQAYVLHRCDSAGCCQFKSERCQPDYIDKVTLQFSSFKTSKKKSFQINADNHTICTCQQINKTNNENIK